MAFHMMEDFANWRGMTVKERGTDWENPKIAPSERTAYGDQQKMKTPARVITLKKEYNIFQIIPLPNMSKFVEAFGNVITIMVYEL